MLTLIAVLLALLVILAAAQVALEWKRKERISLREQVQEHQIRKEQRAEKREQAKERLQAQEFWRKVDSYNGDV